MNYIAHRGIWQNISDSNKLESLKKALEDSNFVGIETDIRVTKDNEYVLYHNTLFKGNLVKNTNYKDMQKDNACKLSDLLKINTKKIILLEIKDFDMDIDNFLKFLDNYNHNIYIMSFNTNVIKKIRDKTNKYKVGVLNYILNSNEDYSFDFICLLNDTLSDYVISSFKHKNIEVIGYGVRKNVKLIYNISYIIDSKNVKL